MIRTILSSSVILRRNACLPFKRIDANDTAKKLAEIFNGTQITDANGKPYKELLNGELVESGLAATARYVYDTDKEYCITVGGRDHFTFCSTKRGDALNEAYSIVKSLDEKVSSSVKYAFHQTFGYETSALSDVGTGLRVKLKLFVPALYLSKTLGRYLRALESDGVALQATDTEDFTVYITNKRTLGVTESEICSAVQNAANYIAAAEKQAMDNIAATEPLAIKDKILRAYGVLTNCATISESEFYGCIGYVRMGIYLGVLKCADSLLFEEYACRVGGAGDGGENGSDANRAASAAAVANIVTR